MVYFSKVMRSFTARDGLGGLMNVPVGTAISVEKEPGLEDMVRVYGKAGPGHYDDFVEILPASFCNQHFSRPVKIPFPIPSGWTRCTECGEWSQTDEDYDICPHCRC